LKFPGIEAFLERYRAAADKEKADPLGLYAPPLAYAQMQVMEQAVARVGKIDQEAIGADFHTMSSRTAGWLSKAGQRRNCGIARWCVTSISDTSIPIPSFLRSGPGFAAALRP
jgi:hypothetical protein